MSTVSHLVVPRYKELGSAKIWDYIRQVEDLAQYFPNYREKELPEREYMWNVIFTLRREASSHLIREARRNRSINNPDNKEDLVEIVPEFLKEIKEIQPQKGKQAE